ncbi:MAG: purine-nucleoside phosphorylase [Anaerolineaceae bacterium]|nr:purine-nucleoside phosphorylase [Anaerolineaceae bacterium]
MNKIPTPHIEATSRDEIAKVVLMPGDPLRAKKIADTYLTDVKLFNQVRGMLGYTGIFNGKKISVMGSGMGFGSIGIYSYELYEFYDVDAIIRIGSCGAAIPDLELLDIILTDYACSTETYARVAHGFEEDSFKGSERISKEIRKVASKNNIKITEGNLGSGNVFYNTINQDQDKYKTKKPVIAFEMEAFALFANAKALNKEAACLVTVSDNNFKKDQILTSEARQNAFDEMMLLSLNSAAALLD